MTDSSRELLIAVPTYNEAVNIGPMLNALLRLDADCDVLVVDDESPDGTAEIARAWSADSQRVEVMIRSGKRGRGRASRAAYARFCEGSHRFLCEIDADFQEEPADILALLAAAREKDCQLVIGSRYVAGGWFDSGKRSLSLAARRALRSVFRTDIQDLTCSFHLMRRDLFDAVPPSRLRSPGFFVFAELHLLAERAGLRIEEVPCRFPKRLAGLSTIGPRQVAGFGLEAMRFRLREGSR